MIDIILGSLSVLIITLVLFVTRKETEKEWALRNSQEDEPDWWY
jgi:hypothetical protein